MNYHLLWKFEPWVPYHEVIVGPENRTVLSADNFLRVNLVGDFVGYTSIPSFEDFYLVTPRLVAAGQPQSFGNNYSKWMLLERVRFTLDGLECNKIGVSYEAYRGQPNFCSSPFWSCLHNQLSDFWEADQNRISRRQPPQYVVEGRFERVNQHPNAGINSFSVGITEVLNTNLLIELSADDIQYVYQRSPGKIVSINIPTFEALTQFGTATVATKNTGKLEASYSLTFDCLRGVNYMEEQFYIMKPEEVIVRSFYLYPTTDQAGKYECAAILKASDFSEVDRAECQFTTTATILDNGTQIVTTDEAGKSGLHGFFESIKRMLKTVWDAVVDFFTGKTCRNKCSSFFDITCHIQYICVSWILLFGLLLAIFPAVTVLLWLLHQKGFFDPLYDWWDDLSGGDQRKRTRRIHGKGVKRSHTRNLQDDYDIHYNNRNHPSHMQKKRRSSSNTHHHALQKHSNADLILNDQHQHKHVSHQHAHRQRHRHKNSRGCSQGYKSETGARRETQKTGRKREARQSGYEYSKQKYGDFDDRYEVD
ncbi:uncharacterized protein A4U43_C08F3930 [Asparagus officinalis]|nr:uncharacterized protein A4U43_C08F3930 [Asparagus officinalis]